MSHKVEFSPEALGDLIDLYDFIASRDGADRAIGYINRIEEFIQNLSAFPSRGSLREDLRDGLRVIGFERRVLIAFQVNSNTLGILRILYGGRSLDSVYS